MERVPACAAADRWHLTCYTPTWGSEPKPKIVSEFGLCLCLSSQTQLKSRTLLENVTKSNLSLHKALQFASFIPLSVVGPPPPAPRAQWSPPILDKTTRLPRALQSQLRFLGETAKKGLLIAFQLIGREREKQPRRWNADSSPSKADWRLCNQMLLTTISIHPLTA